MQLSTFRGARDVDALGGQRAADRGKVVDGGNRNGSARCSQCVTEARREDVGWKMTVVETGIVAVRGDRSLRSRAQRDPHRKGCRDRLLSDCAQLAAAT
jgi:hypothetical protein